MEMTSIQLNQCVITLNCLQNMSEWIGCFWLIAMKCIVQPVGVKTIGKFPSIIAEYLGLENAKSYTEHSYRHTSATLLANADADVLTLKRHGAWKPSTVAENYVWKSVCNKIKIANMIQNTNDSSKINKTKDIATTSVNVDPIIEVEYNQRKMVDGNLHMTFDLRVNLNVLYLNVCIYNYKPNV